MDTGPAAVVADHYEGDDLHRSSEIERWPMFAAAVVERSSVRAVFALPLQWGAVNLGVLDLYRREPGALDDEYMRDAISAADTAALMMLGLRTDPDHGGDGWLDHAVAHRAEIHQATEWCRCNLMSAPRRRWRGCGRTRSCTTGCSPTSPGMWWPADWYSPRTWSSDGIA